jgi:hypothetical protein
LRPSPDRCRPGRGTWTIWSESIWMPASMRWTPPPLTSVFRCSRGLVFAGTRPPSNWTRCSLTAWSEAISGPASTDAPVQRSLLLAVSMGAEQAVGWRREHGQSSRRFRASDCTGRRCPRRLAGASASCVDDFVDGGISGLRLRSFRAGNMRLPGALPAHDLVLLDQNPVIRAAPGGSRVRVPKARPACPLSADDRAPTSMLPMMLPMR